jgi:hypothetical protein
MMVAYSLPSTQLHERQAGRQAEDLSFFDALLLLKLLLLRVVVILLQPVR